MGEQKVKLAQSIIAGLQSQKHSNLECDLRGG
jgi:hypothetical protein